MKRKLLATIHFGKLICCLALTIITCTKVYSQVSPINIGFESGTFSGWTGATGQCCPLITPSTGIDTSRHAITTGNNTDPRSNGLLTVVAPNSLYSARLGNENNSAESEALEFTFIVPSDSLLLNIHFAVMLENGLHPSLKQPRFTYHVSSGVMQPEGCTDLSIIAGESTPDSILNGNLELYQWQKRTINLTGMAGENITIRFETGDCGPGGHFGYAYVDCELTSAVIEVSECAINGSIVLTAPHGVNGTWHNGDISDSLLITTPTVNDSYFLELNSNTTCSFKLPVELNQILPFANFSSVKECNQQVSFTNYSSYVAGSSILWEFGDGINSSALNPVHQFLSTGDHLTSLTIVQPDNCRATFNETININGTNEIEIVTEGDCPQIPVKLVSSIIGPVAEIIDYEWYINHVVHDNNSQTSYVFSSPGQYFISLVTTDIYGCVDTTESLIEILGSLDCLDDYPVPYLPNAFTPNDDGKNDIFELSAKELFTNVILSISNRFGEVISDKSFWDGNRNGINCPEGIYIYKLSYNYQNRKYSMNGTVALIR